MKPDKFYSQTADIYDLRHESPTTKQLRKMEQRIIDRFARGFILDAGCGTGIWMDKAEIGMDMSREMLKLAHDGKPLMIGNIESIPFKDGVFDTVMCMFSVLNICDYDKAVKELSRIVKKNGKVIVSVSSVWDRNYSLKEKKRLRNDKIVKNGSLKRFRISNRNMEMKLFGKLELQELFKRNGFALDFFDSIYGLQKPHWNNFRGFSFVERVRLFLERILPYKDFGCIYVMVFRKVL